MSKKIIWGFFVALLGVAGVWFLLREKEVPPKALAEKAVGIHYAGGGQHVVEGAITLPNPCYALSVAAKKKGGLPEEILLHFLAEETADACVQVEYDAPFRVAFEAADNAVLSATINNLPLGLELERKQRVNARIGEAFMLSVNEQRWVEDLKITFLGVEDDSRCSPDVVCVQAGWVAARFQVGGEELLLRFPGDKSMPNAAVAGSYIITLIDMNQPVRAEMTGEYLYWATLCIEMHDLKG